MMIPYGAIFGTSPKYEQATGFAEYEQASPAPTLVTVPAKTETVGQILDKNWHLLSSTDQERVLAAAQRALNKAKELA